MFGLDHNPKSGGKRLERYLRPALDNAFGRSDDLAQLFDRHERTLRKLAVNGLWGRILDFHNIKKTEMHLSDGITVIIDEAQKFKLVTSGQTYLLGKLTAQSCDYGLIRILDHLGVAAYAPGPLSRKTLLGILRQIGRALEREYPLGPRMHDKSITDKLLDARILFHITTTPRVRVLLDTRHETTRSGSEAVEVITIEKLRRVNAYDPLVEFAHPEKTE
jgi:hypothetical protein